ncbi:hypothetical protein BCV02_13095 [Vibrio breoganii]|uniref:Porin n=2 Tax=Vibrio breoganii TaxID=553239 RepID=A0AAP8SVM6_9VIBR|nr:hypothetical protein [Vibrio breoganii]NMO74679.1 hypothetical protein [Vibrio breoganii]NMR71172.1 hypothetical protein [Vibrio breoganii]PMG01925.1 hypothetical protein BCV02_13095 [Vibrio breoganii]PML88419.1 hypothetical protein BCT67_09905 [Vibrio breoganii]PMP07457.1 hypothetical protein BCS93_16010 [Vibrio breoganii]
MRRAIFITFLLTGLSAPSWAEDTEEKCLSKPEDDRAISRAYHYLNTKFCQPAVWFDDFFADERVTEDARAGTSVRWKNDFTQFENDGFKYNTRIDAKFNLPKVTNRLKLIIESDGEDDLFDLFPRNAEEVENTIGLRYDIYAKGYSSFNIKATFKPKIEARYRFTYPLGINTVSRATQKVYQETELTGESTQFDIDQALSKNFLLRWTSFAEFNRDHADDTSIWDLGTAFVLYQYLSKTQAINYTVSTTGTDYPRSFIDNTLIGMTYRHNVFFKWFYYEVTPEYNWYREYDQGFEEEASIRLRLEIRFENF